MTRARASMPRSPSSAAAAAALISGVLGLSAVGCGADEEPGRPKPSPPRGEATGSAPSKPAPTATAPSATAPPSDAKAPPPQTGRGRRNPESQLGGVGDEEGARTPAMFTGRGGRITPRLVRVPPFLAIALKLRSADGRQYALRFARFTLDSDKAGRSTREISGLRPGGRLVGKPIGGGPSVVIEASAEPGP